MEESWVESTKSTISIVEHSSCLFQKCWKKKKRSWGRKHSVCSIVSASKQHANFTSNTNILPANKLSTYFTLEEHCRRSTKFRDKLII